MADSTSRDQLDAFYNRLQTLPALIRNLGLSIAEGQRAMDQNYIESLAAFMKIVSLVNNKLAPDALLVVTKANSAVESASKLNTGLEAATAVQKAAREIPLPASEDATALLTEIDAAVKLVKPDTPAASAATSVANAAVNAFALRAKAAGPPQAQFLELFRAIAPSHYQFTETSVEVRADLRVATASELTLGANLGIKAGMFSAAVNFSMLKRSASDYQAAADLRCVINAIPADHTMMTDLLARAGTPINASFKGDDAFKAVQEALNEFKSVAIPALPAADQKDDEN